jgi:putative pyruvate formate lyase activating enzyme
MAQYNPLHRATDYPMLCRSVRQEEYDNLLDFLETEGFENVFIQELESAPLFVPDFNREEPFEGVRGQRLEAQRVREDEKVRS